ncbi:MAG: MFS transporter [Bacteroidales bacterium]|nr:MFS transporter [Bacteroidales bacterium]MCB9012913.1 MFS transporter [Bacteroidales bacterium]
MTEMKKLMSDSIVVRWSVLILVSITMYANYYFYDAFSPLKSIMQEKLLWTSGDYGFFQSAYSISNVFLFMAVIGGVILDKLGIRITGFMFTVFMVIGSALTAYGSTDMFLSGGPGYHLMSSFMTSYSPSLKMMSLGFLFFGLGAETSVVVFTKAIVKWFKGKELALALGINLSIGRLGTFSALNISPWLVNLKGDMSVAVWFGTLLLLVGLLTFIAYMFFDLKLDKQAKIDVMDETDEFHISDLGKIITNRSFLYIALLCVTFYSAVFPFIKYAPDLLSNKFGMNVSTAGWIVSMVPMGTIIMTPLFGAFTDRIGKSASLMIYGSLLLVTVHLMFALTRINPYIPMVLLGVAFSLIPAAMWPSVTKIVEEKRLGSAYGLMFSIQNVGLWAFPMLIGKVLDISNPLVTPEAIKDGSMVYDYTNPILMLAFMGVLGVVFALLLKRDDKVSGFGLELPNMKK